MCYPTSGKEAAMENFTLLEELNLPHLQHQGRITLHWSCKSLVSISPCHWRECQGAVGTSAVLGVSLAVVLHPPLTNLLVSAPIGSFSAGLIRNLLEINRILKFWQAGFECGSLLDCLALTGMKGAVLKCNTKKFPLPHIPIHMNIGTAPYFSTLKWISTIRIKLIKA